MVSSWFTMWQIKSRSTMSNNGFRRSIDTRAKPSTSCWWATNVIWPQKRSSIMQLQRYDTLGSFSYWMFVSVHFLFSVSYGDEVTKIRKYYVIFVYILQGKMGKMGKNGKKIMQLKWPKYQKPKDENMGWTKQLWLSIFSNFSCMFLMFRSSHIFVFWFLVFWSL